MRAGEISLIISTYDRPPALEKVLAGVRRQAELPGEILVADDGSGVETRELIASWQKDFPAPLRHLHQADRGFRKTRILNQCLATARGSYLVFLDGDCVPHEKFILDHAMLAEKGYWVQGRRCFVSQRHCAHFAAGVTPVFQWMLWGRVTGWPKGIRLPFPLVRRNMEHRGIIGCNMGFWRDDLLAVNGFDEDYTGWGIGEDSDVGARLYHLGRPRKFVYGRAIVYHLDHPPADRQHVAASHQRLRETIQGKKIRCEKGVNQYLADSRQPS